MTSRSLAPAKADPTCPPLSARILEAAPGTVKNNIAALLDRTPVSVSVTGVNIGSRVC